MIPYIYVTLLSLMLFVLYQCGKSLRKDYRIFSTAGVVSILVYTLNEGLRFGRGIDYSIYWSRYDDIIHGLEVKTDFLFTWLSKIFISLGMSFQCEVIFMSFMFILATLLFIKNYKDIVPLALPLFVFLSMHQVENMVRWYLAYSFFLIGLSFYLSGKGKKNFYLYIVFSILAFFLHYGFAPIPVVFFLVYIRKSPLFSPIITLSLFFSIYFLFKADYMLFFVDYVNLYSYLSSASEGYVEHADYWLTSGFDNMGALDTSIGITEMSVLSLLVIGGYNSLKIKQNDNLIYAYNLFIIGLLLLPISKHIEIVVRYRSVFYFFEAIVLSLVIDTYLIHRRIVSHQVVVICVALLFVKYYSISFVAPFGSSSYKYMYVWDRTNQTYDSILEKYKNDMLKSRMKMKKNN